MNKDTINQDAIDKVKALEKEGHFETIQIVDKTMRDCQNPFDQGFYLMQEDQANEAYGELLNAYYQQKANLKTYIAIRKFEMKVEAGTGGKLPGNELLEDLIKAEIPDLFNAVIVLEGWVGRAENSLRTARSHVYAGKENSSDEFKKDKDIEKEK
jgi:hypothetical protein